MKMLLKLLFFVCMPFFLNVMFMTYSASAANMFQWSCDSSDASKWQTSWAYDYDYRPINESKVQVYFTLGAYTCPNAQKYRHYHQIKNPAWYDVTIDGRNTGRHILSPNPGRINQESTSTVGATISLKSGKCKTIRLSFSRYDAQHVLYTGGIDTNGSSGVALDIQVCNTYQPPWRLEGVSKVRNDGSAWSTRAYGKPTDRARFNHAVYVRDADMGSGATLYIHEGIAPIGLVPTSSTYEYWTSGRKLLGEGWQGERSRQIYSADANKAICQRVSYSPPYLHGSGQGYSNWACIDIPYNYELVPKTKIDKQYIIEGSASYSGVSGSVESISGSTDSPLVHYTLTRFILSNRNSSPFMSYGIKNNINDPCDIVRIHSGMRNCKKLIEGNRTFLGGKRYDVASSLVDDLRGINLNNGETVCYMTTVNRYSHNTTSADYSYDIKCAVVAKKPKVQIWGGDVRTGSQVITSRTETSVGGATRSYGSWAEYGIIANKDVRSASGAGLSSGSAGRSSTEPTRLTFANIGVSTPGNFTNQPFSTVVQVPPVPPAGAAVLAGTKSVAQLQGGYTATNLRLDGGEIPAGRRIVIRASGTVTVTGDIRYTAARLSNAKDIPQLVIVAKQIIIEPQVERVDAWLMTTHNGSISTCGAATGNQPAHGLNVAACAKQLRINGPIHTSKLYLRRTYGAENKPPMHLGTPAEILNLRPDAYLWGHGTAFTTGAIRTMYVKELPPRL